MYKRSLLATLVVAALVAAALIGVVGPEGAVGAQNGKKKEKNVTATLAIQGLTPANEPIVVLSWSWGASQTGTVGGGGGGAGKVNFQDLNFTKATDKLSPEIFKALAQGKHFPRATLLVNADGVSGDPTHRFTFEDVLLASYQPSGSGGSQVLESVSFAFGEVEFTNE
jgi:type VI secretion system secreted protein Hcp